MTLHHSLKTPLEPRPHWRVAAEEAVGLPLRTLVAFRHTYHERANDLFVLGRGGEIDRLVEIIRRGVVPLGKPVFEDLLFRCAGVEADLHGQRGDSITNEVALVAANEYIVLRVGGGLHTPASPPCYLARPI